MQAPELPTLPAPEQVMVVYLPIDPYIVFVLVFFLLFFAVVWAVVATALEPYRKQKKRERECQHVMDKYVHEVNGEVRHFTYFCKKCNGMWVVAAHQEFKFVKPKAPATAKRKRR